MQMKKTKRLRAQIWHISHETTKTMKKSTIGSFCAFSHTMVMVRELVVFLSFLQIIAIS